MEKEKEKEEGEKLGSFFSAVYEFFNPVPFVPVIPAAPVNAFVPVFVPVVLPARFVPVAFVPESSVPVNDTNSLGSVNHHCITTSSTV